MEELAELMQRLLEIQSGGRARSPEPVAEDERLMDGRGTVLTALSRSTPRSPAAALRHPRVLV